MTERLHFHFSLSCIGEGNGNPLQCSCLESPRDEEASWWAGCLWGHTESDTTEVTQQCLLQCYSHNSSHPPSPIVSTSLSSMSIDSPVKLNIYLITVQHWDEDLKEFNVCYNRFVGTC